METTGPLLALGYTWAALALASYVCAAIAVVKMFQNNEPAWAIASILTFPIPIVALARTVLKRDDWNARPLAFTWLGVVATGVLLSIAVSTFARLYIADIGVKAEDFPVLVR